MGEASRKHETPKNNHVWRTPQDYCHYYLVTWGSSSASSTIYRMFLGIRNHLDQRKLICGLSQVRLILDTRAYITSRSQRVRKVQKEWQE